MAIHPAKDGEAEGEEAKGLDDDIVSNKTQESSMGDAEVSLLPHTHFPSNS